MDDKELTTTTLEDQCEMDMENSWNTQSYKCRLLTSASFEQEAVI